MTARIVDARRTEVMLASAGRLGIATTDFESVHLPWPEHAAIIPHSNSMRADWSLETAPRILLCDPAVIAGWLVRDQAVEGADLAIVVLKRS